MLSAEEARAQCLAALEEATHSPNQPRAFVGLDGFVDEIIHVVDKREDANHFDRIPSMAEFAARIAEAAGKSTNIELVTQRVKLGGNGPIMANALASLGVNVTYVGALGYPNLHPVFQPLSDRSEVFSIAEAAHTDALEFEDGKIMLGKMTPLNDVTWKTLMERMGRDRLTERIQAAHLVSFLNWTMIPNLSEVWTSILEEKILPDRAANRIGFFDLCDPEKRENDDILKAMEILGRFRQHLRVILGLNEKEAMELADVLGIEIGEATPEGRCELARKLHAQLDVDALVVHPVAYALAVTDSETVWVPGPFVKKPVITTGAGDHFNAGFSLGALMGFPPRHCLNLGVASSGHYVRSGRSPEISDLLAILRHWPDPTE
tara:strand:+ start:279 stop:1409 length:1131 start_codon:yes stop_codon:yes gene_type:complete